MKEIIFRGKRLDNGEWVYGNLMQGSTSVCISQFLTTDTLHRIDPATVGQYTGLQDKNGKEVFIGDIVKCNNKVEEYIGLVDWDTCNPSMCIQYKSKNGFEYVEYDFIHCGNMTIEILGNRWDNPKVLKGGEK